MNNNKIKWLYLAILTLIWGSSFILIKKSLNHFSPYQVGALRVLIAGVFLLPIAIKNIRKFPKKQLKWLILSGVTGNFIPMFLFPMAEKYVASSIAGIINSMMPIFVIIVGAVMWKMTTTKRQIFGVMISFTGVMMLMLSGNQESKVGLFPVLLLLLATILYAISVTTAKAKLIDIPAQILSAYIFSVILLLPSLLTLLFTGFFDRNLLSTDVLQGLGYVSILSIFGTGLAMMLSYKLMNLAGALFASSVTLIMPIVAVLWGILDDEKISLIQVFGGMIILGGLIFLRTTPKNIEVK